MARALHLNTAFHRYRLAMIALVVAVAGGHSALAQTVDPPMPKLSPARSAPAATTTAAEPAASPRDAPQLEGANSLFAEPDAPPLSEDSPMELRTTADTMLTYPDPGEEGSSGDFDGPFDDEGGAGISRALAPDVGPPSDIRPGTFTLEARLAVDDPPLGNGVKWRIFGDVPGSDGHLPLLGEAEGGVIYIRLDQGAYYVHAAYGRAGATRKISVDGPTGGDVLVLNAGGMRLLAMNAGDQPLGVGQVAFDIYAPDEGGAEERYLLIPNAPPGRVIALNAGTYHVVSKYGDSNAVARADVRIEPGKLTETTLFQNAARLTLKLVEEHGGEAIADTAWSVVTLAGESVVESVGAFPSVVLAEGNYTAMAKNGNRTYQTNFSVVPGLNRDIEVLAE
jgi:hypothetical protein